jgi:2,5-diketo-D-gluconate reductase A
MKKLSLRRCLYFTQAGLRTTPERIREKFELFDFELDAGEVERIDALDRGEAGRVGPHSDRFAYAG